MKNFFAVLLACLIATASPAQNIGGGGTVYLRQFERGTAGYVITGQGAGAAPVYTALAGAGLGDFSGPASSTDNAIVRFDGTGGKTGQNSAVTIADTTGAIQWGAGTTASLTSLAGTNLLLAGGTAGTGAVRVTNTTAASTTTTGSLQNSGGFGNAGSIYSGLSVLIQTTDNVFGYFNGAAYFYKPQNSGTNTGDVAAVNGVRLLKGATAVLTAGNAANNAVTLPDTTPSTSTTTGSFINAGGFGNAGAANIGGNLTVSGNTTAGANLTVLGVLTTGGPVSPAPGSTGNAGMIIWDANYIYICIAANTWKRAALSAY